MGIFGRNSSPAADVDAIVAMIVDQVKAALPSVVPASQPLPREDFGNGGPFAPGVPLTPMGIDPREPGQMQPAPRRSEFPVSVNLQIAQQNRLIPFSVLRDTADRVDVMRRCVETRKSQMLALDWDITLSKQTIQRVMLDNHLTSPGEAAQIARTQFADDIARLRTWWEKPDKFNGMDWPTWLGVMLEEHLVVDALSIYPRRQINGDTAAFEILDGATIKPLLDHRGSTPMPPNPAFQQILYGFPRGEYTASDPTSVDSQWSTAQLVYRPRLRRSFTPYGLPDTESALSAADLYLKRMTWVRESFTEGSTPDTWMIPPKDSKMQPDQLLAWETALNAQLGGQMAERRKLRATPPGWSTEQMRDFAELYKPELDELLIKLLCSCYSVMPTEIGFPPGGGIGGKGHQEGEENSSYRRAVRPTAQWMESVTSELSRDYLRMPAELQFTLIGWETEDQESDERVADSRTRGGRMVINEDRAAKGLPLFDFPEADEPFIVTGSGLVFLNGAKQAQAEAAAGEGAPSPQGDAAATEASPAPAADPASATNPQPDDAPQAGDPIAADEPVPDGFVRVSGHLRAKPAAKQVEEAAKFVRYVERRHGRSWRPFEFEAIDATLGAELNDAGLAGDLATIKSMVADLGKAKARRISRAERQAIVEDHAQKLSKSLRGLLPAPSELLAAWTDLAASRKQAKPTAAAEFVEDQMDEDYDDLDDQITQLLKRGHSAAYQASLIDGFDEDADESNPDNRGRLAKLLDTVEDMRGTLIGATIIAVGVALVSEHPEENLPAALDERAEMFATVELTAATSAGTLDATQAQHLAFVRITATPECDFCQDYEGRILELDEESGMPPLHNGCQCDLEPLTPED